MFYLVAPFTEHPAELEGLVGLQYRLQSTHPVWEGRYVIEVPNEVAYFLELDPVPVEDFFRLIPDFDPGDEKYGEKMDAFLRDRVIADWRSIPDPAEKDAAVQAEISAVLARAYPGGGDKAMSMQAAVEQAFTGVLRPGRLGGAAEVMGG